MGCQCFLVGTIFDALDEGIEDATAKLASKQGGLRSVRSVFQMFGYFGRSVRWADVHVSGLDIVNFDDAKNT